VKYIISGSNDQKICFVQIILPGSGTWYGTVSHRIYKYYVFYIIFYYLFSLYLSAVEILGFPEQNT